MFGDEEDIAVIYATLLLNIFQCHSIKLNIKPKVLLLPYKVLCDLPLTLLYHLSFPEGAKFHSISGLLH